MKKLLTILFLLVVQHSWATNYNWPTSNGNILINRTNYPLLTAMDTVFILPKSGGYRSRSLANLNSHDPNHPIFIIWMPGAFITPNTSGPLFANSIDSIYGVTEVGFTMNDNIDVAFSSYGATGYIKYFLAVNDTLRGMNGWFPSGALTLTLPAFTGDSTNCFYNNAWINCDFDSSVGANSGQTGIWIGSVTSAKNQFWVGTRIINTTFRHYSSSANPASYVHAECSFGMIFDHDSTCDLGMSVVNPVGHAAQFLMIACQFFIHDCVFGPANFGDEIRNFGAGVIPQWFTGTPGTTGRSEVYMDFVFRKRKYPFLETRTDPGGDETTLSPFYKARTGPIVYNITAFEMAMGVGNMFYNSSIIDCYELDTVYLKNSFICGPTDTVWTACNSQGCNAIITTPAGSPTKWDTASLQFNQTYAASGLGDSILGSFRPKLKGILYNQGVAVPLNITMDLRGTAVPTVGRPVFGLSTGMDIGAVQLPPAASINIPRGARIILH